MCNQLTFSQKDNQWKTGHDISYMCQIQMPFIHVFMSQGFNWWLNHQMWKITHQKCQRGSFHVISPLSLGKNIIPKRIFQTTLDGSEIPNNHLGCIKPCKKLGYPTISTGAGFLPSTVPSKTQVFHPHLQPSNSPPVSHFQVSNAHCSIANAWLQFPCWQLKISRGTREEILLYIFFWKHLNLYTVFLCSNPFCKWFWSGLCLNTISQGIWEHEGLMAIGSQNISEKLVISLHLLEK